MSGTLHLPPAGAARTLPLAVPDRFAWSALVFGWLALLRPSAWIAGLLIGAASITIETHLAGTRLLLPVIAMIHLALAAFLPEIRRWQLRLSGWRSTTGQVPA